LQAAFLGESVSETIATDRNWRLVQSEKTAFACWAETKVAVTKVFAASPNGAFTSIFLRSVLLSLASFLR